MRKVFAAVLVMFFLAPDSNAYLELVHWRVTKLAITRTQRDLRQRLDITAETRISGVELSEWAARGADAEDALPRPLNHFFDPVHQEPLTIGAWPVCFSSPGAVRADSWALTPSGFNGRTIRHAQNLYFDAVIAPNQGTRNVALRELFFTLGHVVHLVQDMAQPEHTRNDQHLPHSHSLLGNADEASLYEHWGVPNIAPINPSLPALIDYDGYPNVVLPDYASYFHTDDRGLDGRSRGKGLADFSNRGFVTQDTNYPDQSGLLALRCSEYDDPRESEATGRLQTVRRSVKLPDGRCCVIREVEEGIYTSHPMDYYTGTRDTDPFHAFVSAVDLETRRYDPHARFYSLADESWQSRASLLIPRAVGYSAGMIDHFFRGQIDAEWRFAGSSNGVVRYDLTIVNRSTQRIGADAEIAALYRTQPSYFGRNNSDDTAMIVRARISDRTPFTGLAPGESVTIRNLVVPHLRESDGITKFERRVAIRGTLGSEENAVIGLVQKPAAPSGIVVEMTWEPANAHACLNVRGFAIGSARSHSEFCWADSDFVISLQQRNFPGLTLSHPNPAGGPMSIRVIPQPSAYRGYLFGVQPGAVPIDITYSVTVDGVVVLRDVRRTIPAATIYDQNPLFSYP